MTRPGESGRARSPESRITDLAAGIELVKGEVGRLGGELHSEVGKVQAELHQLGNMVVNIRDGIAEQIGPDLHVQGEALEAVGKQVDELQDTVKALVAKERATKNPPIDWVYLSAKQADREWDKLAQWADEVLPYYEITRGQLPDCWPLHWPALLQVSWMRTLRVEAYMTRSHPVQAAEWNTRWLDEGLRKIKEAIPDSRCWPEKDHPGQHLQDRVRVRQERQPPAGVPTAPSTPAAARAASRAAVVAQTMAAQTSGKPWAQGSTPAAAQSQDDSDLTSAAAQLTSGYYWGGYWQQAKAADITRRLERESRHVAAAAAAAHAGGSSAAAGDDEQGEDNASGA